MLCYFRFVSAVLTVIMLLYSNPILTGGTFILGKTAAQEILSVCSSFVNSRTKIVKAKWA